MGRVLWEVHVFGLHTRPALATRSEENGPWCKRLAAASHSQSTCNHAHDVPCVPPEDVQKYAWLHRCPFPAVAMQPTQTQPPTTTPPQSSDAYPPICPHPIRSKFGRSERGRGRVVGERTLAGGSSPTAAGWHGGVAVETRGSWRSASEVAAPLLRRWQPLKPHSNGGTIRH